MDEMSHLQKDWYTAVNDLLDSAWGIIANAYGGDWSLAQNPDWEPAATRWRDTYHEALGLPTTKEGR